MPKRLEELLLKMNKSQIETLATTFRNSRSTPEAIPTGDHDELVQEASPEVTEDNFNDTLEEMNW